MDVLHDIELISSYLAGPQVIPGRVPPSSRLGALSATPSALASPTKSDPTCTGTYSGTNPSNPSAHSTARHTVSSAVSQVKVKVSRIPPPTSIRALNGKSRHYSNILRTPKRLVLHHFFWLSSASDGIALVHSWYQDGLRWLEKG
jgi:hypothetical protein